MIIKSLPAYYGDSTLISWGTHPRRNILVDGGPRRTYYHELRPALQLLLERGESIDLLVITHIDQDHIGGILAMFEDTTLNKNFIKQIWFNSGSRIAEFLGDHYDKTREIRLILSDTKAMSFREGNSLERFLDAMGWPGNIISAPSKIAFHDAEITILSPGQQQLSVLNRKWETENTNDRRMSSNKRSDHGMEIDQLLASKFEPDSSVVNGSSIVFMIKVEDSSLLLLADSFPWVVEENLRALYFDETKKLEVSAVKIAHHGSKFNNSHSLYSPIKSSRFLISTDGSRDYLPHKEALSQIITSNPGCDLYFNYLKPSRIFTQAEMEQYDFVCHHSNEIEL